MADGSLLDYLVNNGEGEQIWCQTLQVLTFFPCESNKMNILFKKILNKRSLTYNDRYLVYAVTKVKTQRLVSNSKDTLDAFNKLKMLNEQSKATMKSFWDKASCQSGFLTKFKGAPGRIM
ncbi:hypothetical protein TVAG_353640 [Trichomonas vaginalis G3]|uniref:Uncharacterized protein n=1 Tax=Trichomonas vaginalis (strain ATCC PRA-98 / G3) TaxID=412133 RepID=A2EN86_TRIV3|nr:hypothetical protein TVAG_353640 [Trichomonas vaginalis G3]|eukprot:XP_001318146.1 hypothetical protein [Trichomonas vaginalis G3]